MGALPKKKVSRRRRDNRRSHHGIKQTTLVACPNCRQPTLPHQVCPHCGTYRDRQVLDVQNEAPR